MTSTHVATNRRDRDRVAIQRGATELPKEKTSEKAARTHAADRTMAAEALPIEELSPPEQTREYSRSAAPLPLYLRQVRISGLSNRLQVNRPLESESVH